MQFIRVGRVILNPARIIAAAWVGEGKLIVLHASPSDLSVGRGGVGGRIAFQGAEADALWAWLEDEVGEQVLGEDGAPPSPPRAGP